MSGAEKATILVSVAASPLPKRQVLKNLGAPITGGSGGRGLMTGQEVDQHPGTA